MWNDTQVIVDYPDSQRRCKVQLADTGAVGSRGYGPDLKLHGKMDMNRRVDLMQLFMLDPSHCQEPRMYQPAPALGQMVKVRIVKSGLLCALHALGRVLSEQPLALAS